MIKSITLMGGIYICNHCGFVADGKRDNDLNDVRVHIWKEHRDVEIEETLIRLESFVRALANRFCNKYKIDTTPSEVAQFLRTKIFETLVKKYDPAKANFPTKGDPTTDRLARASCSNFLKLFLQKANYKKNLPLKEVSLTGYNTGREYETATEGHPDDEKSLSVIIDHRIKDPLEDQYYIDAVGSITELLTPQELKVFVYLADIQKEWTQQEIANDLGISQPMVSSRIKAIRRKITDNHIFDM